MSTLITLGSIKAPDSDLTRKAASLVRCPNVCDLIDNAPFDS